MPSPRRSSLTALGLILLLLAACQTTTPPEPTPVPPTATATATASSTQIPTEAPTQTPYVITATAGKPIDTPVAPRGVFFLSLADDGHDHLFAYSPEGQPMTRLTANPWDDVAPAVSPTGAWLAYASRKNGYWDLYLLDLVGGGTIRMTDTPEYDGNPSWSPDGAWLVYESYVDSNLELFIHSATDPSQIPIRLTTNTWADFSPTWSPLGRQIAFVSNRSGEPEIWIADLNRTGQEMFFNCSRAPASIEAHPAWSPDGSMLSWSTLNPSSGVINLAVWDARHPELPARQIGAGDRPLWLDNSRLATILSEPYQTYLTGYTLTGTLSLPPILLPSQVNGLSFGTTAVALPGPFQAAAQVTPQVLYSIQPHPQAGVLAGRASLVTLQNVQAAYPQLHESAYDSFVALRDRVAHDTGWNALANLENAFVPLTIPLEPGLGDDWLYTGRAVTLNPALIQAGWMIIVRQGFNQQVYWRIYLRTVAQDGSQGTPLTDFPWDFSARVGDSNSYENGGKLMTTLPTGYWLDLTSLAAQFGWERLPALANWRTYYSGTRFNELAFTQGLDWVTAMRQLYPLEALLTPTVVIPPTRTFTRTPLYFRSPTPTRTPTLHPTNTP
jgi:TolB protein